MGWLAWRGTGMKPSRGKPLEGFSWFSCFHPVLHRHTHVPSMHLFNPGHLNQCCKELETKRYTMWRTTTQNLLVLFACVMDYKEQDKAVNSILCCLHNTSTWPRFPFAWGWLWNFPEGEEEKSVEYNGASSDGDGVLRTAGTASWDLGDFSKIVYKQRLERRPIQKTTRKGWWKWCLFKDGSHLPSSDTFS